MKPITKQQIDIKSQEVNENYYTFGFHSKEYQKSFDKLHDMRMKFMAQKYRSINGLGDYAKTPYCEGM